MKKTFFGILFLAVVLTGVILYLVLFAGRPKEVQKPPEKLAALVNGESITVPFFQDSFERFAKRANLPEDVSSITPELKMGFLNRLIETRLLLQEAKTLGLTVSDEEIDQEIALIAQDYPKNPFDPPLEGAGLAFEEWKTEQREKLLINKLIHREVDSVIHVSDEDIRLFYKEHNKEFELPWQVHARHILVATEEEAQTLRKRVLKGEKFEELAREHSLSPEAEKGGDLGVFPKGQMPEEFDEVVFRYKEGAVTRVVKSPYGFHVFRILKRFPPRTLSLEEARDEIADRIFQARREQFFREWLDSLKSQARITLFPENLSQTDGS